MKLKAYLEERDLTFTAFARLIGTSHEAVRRYADEDRVPTPEVMRRVIAVTDGLVTPNDFYEFPTPTPSEAA